MRPPLTSCVASRRSILTAGLFALACAAGAPSPANARSLEQELLKSAPQVLEHLQKHNCHNVGVLKFLVQQSSDSTSNNAGPINLNMALRLEVALILANDSDPKKSMGIIARANEVAAQTPGANHLTAKGRQALFRPLYSLAWGNRTVRADAFVTGVIRFSADLREMTVAIQTLRAKAEELDKVLQFTVATNASVLNDAGVSFLLRGIKDQDRLTDSTAIEAASRLRNRQAAFPSADNSAPITLEIYYDGKRQEAEISDGVARIPEPREKQDVYFILRRKPNIVADNGGARGSNGERYAIVLKVNGENTLHQERLPSLQCRKWVLAPEDKPIVIRGFYLPDNKTVQKFRVLSSEEAKQKEMYYGVDVGTISMTVYREKRGKDDPVLASEDEGAVRRARYPDEKPRSLDELKNKLRVNGKRKLIVDGQKIEGPTLRHVEFRTDPVPVMSAVISYYRP